MAMPDNLLAYLKEIQDYLELQKTELEKEYKIQNEELPNPSPFSELEQAIECVKKLKGIQKTINKYWEDLDN